jgi:hypothetical protein
MPGCNVAYVINAADRGYYEWHEFCVRFWMHLNYKQELDGVTWEDRLSSVLWLALTALVLGENVLIHCRQGKHRSGVLAMLLMSILARPGSEDWILHSPLNPQAAVGPKEDPKSKWGSGEV